jgi:glycogen(starch) synthase
VHILFFSEPTYPQHPGGAGKCTHLMAAGLVARGHRATIVCPTGGGDAVRETIRGVDVHRVPVATRRLSAAGGESATAAAMLAYLNARVPLDGVDVVHDSGGFLSYFYPVELHLRATLGIPLVIHFQFLNAVYQLALSEQGLSAGLLGMETNVSDRVQCFPARFAAAVIFPSFEEAAIGRRLYRPPPDRVAVIPNPVDLELHTRATPDRWRERLAPRGEQLVVFGGRIDSPMKGADLVASAFERIVAARPNARLVLLNSAEPDSPLFQRLGHAVIPLGWTQDEATVASIIAAADVVVMPSRYEPFGLMCAEAMAVGVPVVATATGGLREMIRDGENGFLLRARDTRRLTAEIADRVLSLLADAALRRRLGERARAMMRARCGLEAVSAAWEALYTALPRAGARREIEAPMLTADDRVQYLSVLEDVGGAEGRSFGEKVFDEWQRDVDARCRACNRGQLAREGLALLALRARETVRVEEARAAVAGACPLGLLQRHVVNRRRIAQT